MGKRTAQSDTNKDITSDSQVNNYFPYRWSPASLTFNIYFYLFLSIFIYNTNNDKKRHTTSKLTKEPKQKSRLGTTSNKTGGGGDLTSLRSTNPRPWSCLGSSDKIITTKSSHHKTRTNHYIKSKLSTSIYTYFLLFYHKARQRTKWAGDHNASRLHIHR